MKILDRVIDKIIPDFPEKKTVNYYKRQLLKQRCLNSIQIEKFNNQGVEEEVTSASDKS